MRALYTVLAIATALVTLRASPSVAQQITIDKLWSTTWDSSKVQELSNPNIRFVAGSALTASVNVTSKQAEQNKNLHDLIGISIFDNQPHQLVDTFGGGITDSVAISLQAFKSKHAQEYDDLLHLLFSTDASWLEKGGVGMNTVRVPLGASDFGVSPYSFDDTEDGSEDMNLELFTVKKAPKLWMTLRDMVAVNPALKIIVASWSAPGWMKENANPDQPLFGGNLKPGMEQVFANYLVRAVVDLQRLENLKVFAMSPQNEPQYAGTKYPTMMLSVQQEIKLGALLRRGLDSAGFGSVKLFLWDHNWDNASYALEVLNVDPAPWDAVAWHGYAGAPSAQKTVADAFPDKDTYFTEMTRVTQSYNEPYKNIKNTARDLLIGSIRYMSRSVVMWNMVLQKDEDGFTTPHLPEVCTNCNAAVLLMPDADSSETHANKAKRGLDPLKTSRKPAARTKEAQRVLPSDLVDARQTGSATTYDSLLFKRTSDFSVLSHLSAAVRPSGASKSYSRRIGVSSTDETTELGGRVLAQAFRQDGVRPGMSRFSLVLLNQNDHYETGNFEAATSVIAFRGLVANVTTVPGLYTLSWEAPTVASAE